MELHIVSFVTSTEELESFSETFSTSPSVYMLLGTASAWNSCGGNDRAPLGWTVTSTVVPMDLTDISTLQPYADATATTRGPPLQLQLSDLDFSACSSTEPAASIQRHPLDNASNRCNPSLQWPIQLKRIGYPYWAHCNEYNIAYVSKIPESVYLFGSTTWKFPEAPQTGQFQNHFRTNTEFVTS